MSDKNNEKIQPEEIQKAIVPHADFHREKISIAQREKSEQKSHLERAKTTKKETENKKIFAESLQFDLQSVYPSSTTRVPFAPKDAPKKPETSQKGPVLSESEKEARNDRDNEREIDTAKKSYSEALGKEYNTEISAVKETGNLSALSPDKAKTVHAEILRKSITLASLPDDTVNSLKNSLSRVPRIFEGKSFDQLSESRQNELILAEATKPEKMGKKIEKYQEALKNAEKDGKKLTQSEKDEIAKTTLGLKSFDVQQREALNLDVLKSDNERILGEESGIEIVERVLAEKGFQELTKTLGDEIKFDDLPNHIKEQITSKGTFFNKEDLQLTADFLEELDLAKGEANSPKRDDESPEQYAKRMEKNRGINPDRMAELASRIGTNRDKLSPLTRFLADLCAIIAGTMPPGFLTPEQEQMWANYRQQQGFDNGKTPYENYAASGGVGGGGDLKSGTMEGYSLDVNGEITAEEQKTIQTISEAYKKQVPDASMQEKLTKVLERHAKNNPNFRADQPFLAHDVGTKKAFIYFPDGSVKICGATHGYAGIGNKEGGGATSLGSKRLAPQESEGMGDDHKFKSRVIVHGLESINANDKKRLVRVHESRGPGSKTAGCTGLDPQVAEIFQNAISKAEGGAQEVFNSNSFGNKKDNNINLSKKEGKETFMIDGKNFIITPPENAKNLSDRNKNPLNIKHPDFPGDSKGHSVCPSYEVGIKIAVQDLEKKFNGQSQSVREYTSKKYGQARDALYVRDIIGTWAPESDGNNPDEYTRTVLGRMGFTGDLLKVPISTVKNRIPELVLQMAKFEGCQAKFEI